MDLRKAFRGASSGRRAYGDFYLFVHLYLLQRTVFAVQKKKRNEVTGLNGESRQGDVLEVSVAAPGSQPGLQWRECPSEKEAAPRPMPLPASLIVLHCKIQEVFFIFF